MNWIPGTNRTTDGGIPLRDSAMPAAASGTEASTPSAASMPHSMSSCPVIRQRLAQCHTKVEIMRYLGLRSLTQFLSGHHPGPESGIFKNFWSEYHQEVTQLALDILGADAMAPSGRWPTSSFQTDSPGAPNDSASWVGTS